MCIRFFTEWYWKCWFKRYLCQGLAAVLALLSALVVWSELTFFNASPVLSVFAIFVNLAKEYYDYLSIEVIPILFKNCGCISIKIVDRISFSYSILRKFFTSAF